MLRSMKGREGGISLPSPNMALVNEGRLNLSVVPSASNNVVIATNVGGRRVCGAGGVEVLQCRHWKQMEGCVRCRRPDVCCKAAAVDAKKRENIFSAGSNVKSSFVLLFVPVWSTHPTTWNLDAAKDKSQIKI